MSEDKSGDKTISRTFVLTSSPTQQDVDTINDALDRIQSNNSTIMWPKIDRMLINEFQMVGYMVRVFPTLYPHEDGDL